jgi:demethylmenaquinone methyltransferase / 2-methoxy-6-polyprenyl-1,4-benzoquinol methylase
MSQWLANAWGRVCMMALLLHPPILFARLYQVPWYQGMLREALGPVTAGQAVLEVGSAAGDFAHHLALEGAQVQGLDRSQRMVAAARRIPSAAQFCVGDALHLPFGEQQFDHVFAASLLNVLAEPGAAVREMRRVCRSGGRICAIVPAAGFSDAQAQACVQSWRLRGFDAVAFTAWHRLARKLELATLHSAFADAQFAPQQLQCHTVLGGMAWVVSAVLPDSSGRGESSILL